MLFKILLDLDFLTFWFERHSWVCCRLNVRLKIKKTWYLWLSNCWNIHKPSFLGFTTRWVIICSTVCNILMATDYVWNCLLCVSVLCKVRIIWRQPVLTALHEVSLTYDFTWSAIYKTITRRSQYTLHLVKFKTADVHVVAMHNLYFKKNFQGILETMISNAF